MDFQGCILKNNFSEYFDVSESKLKQVVFKLLSYLTLCTKDNYLILPIIGL